MKGVVLSINPQATVIDISHHVPRHDVVAASFALLASYRYQPAGTVVVVVVDPGVGTARRIICARAADRVFLAPDNGVLTGVLTREPPVEMVCVENEAYFLGAVSTTFHGRDIFAPVAAHLSLGVPLARLGCKTEAFHRKQVAEPRVEGRAAAGVVVWVDGFGNLITNLTDTLVGDLSGRWGGMLVQVGKGQPFAIARNYESVESSALLGIIGSSGYLEISVREGNAAQVLGVGIGERVSLFAA
jgi:S-adenosylmethionine hydrolase